MHVHVTESKLVSNWVKTSQTYVLDQITLTRWLPIIVLFNFCLFIFKLKKKNVIELIRINNFLICIQMGKVSLCMLIVHAKV